MSEDKVLIIDDEPDIRELLSLTLKRMGLCSDVASTFKEGIDKIKKKDYFLVLSDMRLPDGDGSEIVHYIQKNKPQVPVAVITAYGNVEGAVDILKAGAFDYVSKPINLAMLKSLVETALRMYQKQETKDEILIGESDIMKSLRESIQKLARSQAPVFVHGESGVGKELVARLIH
ncbi:MAG: sigma-54-dependent Fis family transcriptional regulator, partial [Alphaproteobacteria bacterium]|nr:sigma-54-dependent Fis family transcriptional regulator [Alphaproteobacteria bacterium]